MARNLQGKLSPSDTISVYDVNKDVSEKWLQEVKSQQPGGAVPRVARHAGDAAREAVCCPLLCPGVPFSSGFHDEFV
jgi:hypothetical protein